MNDAKHTPGPWERDGQKYGTLTEYVEAKGLRVAAIYEVDIDNDAEVEANARLIAAAPDLLEALKGLLEIAEIAMPDTFFKSDSRTQAARAAIAKAQRE